MINPATYNMIMLCPCQVLEVDDVADAVLYALGTPERTQVND